MSATRVLVAALAVNLANTAYLSWRYVALHAKWVEPHTGLCSWTTGIDCDVVLMTPEARAFYVPNALLGLGFALGCLLWWFGGRRLGEEGSGRTQPLVVRKGLPESCRAGLKRHRPITAQRERRHQTPAGCYHSRGEPRPPTWSA